MGGNIIYKSHFRIVMQMLQFICYRKRILVWWDWETPVWIALDFIAPAVEAHYTFLLWKPLLHKLTYPK